MLKGFLFSDWNQFNYFFGLAAIFLALSQIGWQHLPLDFLAKLLYRRTPTGMERVKVKRFLGIISFVAFLFFLCFALIMSVRALYSMVWFFTTPFISDWTDAVFSVVMICVVIFLVWFVRHLWRMADNLPYESSRNELVSAPTYSALISSMTELTTTIIEREAKIDKLIKAIEEQNKTAQKGG